MDVWNDSRGFLHFILLWFSIQHTGSSCNDDHVRKCKQAAKYGNLQEHEGGGVCTQKQYVHYTHLCTLSNMSPHLDHCCCALDQKVLCCRYHQGGEIFRCAEPEDTIAIISHRAMPLKLLLPAILGPVALLSCCIVCCICRYHKWASQKKKRRKEEAQQVPAMHPTTMGHQIGLVSEMEPLNHSPLGGVDDWKRIPPDGIPERTHLEPSAPPEDQMTGLPPYSEGAPQLPSVPSYANNNIHGHSRQDFVRQDSSASSQYGSNSPTSGPPGTSSGPGSVCPTCPNCSGSACAPPAYEESLQHPIMHHHEESVQRALVDPSH